jgi:hypothetical protein
MLEQLLSKGWGCKFMADMFWVCECGEEFPESGDRKGWGQVWRHSMDHKHKVKGLFDSETGEMLVKGPDMRNAINKGYLQPKEPKTVKSTPKKSGKDNGQVSSTTRAKMRFTDVELDPSLWILFDLARLKWPDEYDDTPESFAFWVAECIFAFYQEHAEELGFDILLAKSIERIQSKGGTSWESQA